MLERKRSKEVAEKVRQASRSTDKKCKQLEPDLNNMLLALKEVRVGKGEKDTVRLWAEKK